jgi:TetR/AcrR family transcriptional regulator
VWKSRHSGQISAHEREFTVAPRRIGASDSKIRLQLLDAAEQLMLDEGYAAVTSRRVGTKAGLSPQLVHYYFRSMDELFLEMFRRRAEEGLGRFADALSSDDSLKVVWDFMTASPGPAFNVEFVALANHRKAIRAEIARYAERYRTMQLTAVVRALQESAVPAEYPPVVFLLAMMGISQVMALEDVLGVSSGHAETVAFVEQLVHEIDAARG